MNTRSQQIFLLDQKASIVRSKGAVEHRRRCRRHLAGLLILSLGAAGIGTQAKALKARPASHSRAANGTLKVWVPAAMIGDDYWIHANGRIVSAPPRVPAISRGRCGGAIG
ncbi:MAG TPA: hypothetical protein VMW15_14295 [Terracidiphilus sp.]|nr:hypothetical protein [Terracidiphilus sp.]